ncbi:MAG: hypothetical protein H6806_08630 [Planctomycetes bacterium]|nr:hypothetical protein [Planctomycetota bacterium]
MGRRARACRGRGARARLSGRAPASGAHPLPGFLIPKWLRFLRNHPDAARRARRLVFAKDWLGLRLTGRHATDRSEASASQVYDFRSDDWAEELWQVFEMPPLRAAVLRSTEIAGYVTAEASEATGLPAGVPVAAGAGDNEAAALGAGALGDGRVAVILGTSGTVVGWSLHRSPAGGLVWNRHVPQRGYAATGTVLSAGRAIDWARSTFFPPGTRMVEVLRSRRGRQPVGGAPAVPADARGRAQSRARPRCVRCLRGPEAHAPARAPGPRGARGRRAVAGRGGRPPARCGRAGRRAAADQRWGGIAFLAPLDRQRRRDPRALRRPRPRARDGGCGPGCRRRRAPWLARGHRRALDRGWARGGAGRGEARAVAHACRAPARAPDRAARRTPAALLNTAP